MSLELQEPKLLGSYQPGWYSWPKVETLVTDRIRLVARDRALLADLDEAQKAMDRAVLGFGLGDVFEGELIAVTARLKALREEVKRAAESWLGPEVPDGDHLSSRFPRTATCGPARKHAVASPRIHTAVRVGRAGGRSSTLTVGLG